VPDYDQYLRDNLQVAGGVVLFTYPLSRSPSKNLLVDSINVEAAPRRNVKPETLTIPQLLHLNRKARPPQLTGANNNDLYDLGLE